MSFNELTPAQAERLALLAEECGEVVQAIGKVLRHGYESCHPDAVSADFDNRYELSKEIGDLIAAVDFLSEAKDIHANVINDQRGKKRTTVAKYLHHAKVKP
jgi:NTP pyrophosphatase (non-canonical NTP hydrolase)